MAKQHGAVSLRPLRMCPLSIHDHVCVQILENEAYRKSDEANQISTLVGNAMEIK